MKIVRDDPAARWLPSRHRFALARLIAFILFRVEDSRPRLSSVDHLLLAIDRDQSAIENYFLSIWFIVMAVCYIAAALPLPAAISFIVAVPLATIAMQIPICAGVPMQVSSVGFMLLLFSESAYYASTASAVRYVAWFSLIIMVMNTMAWLVMIFLRHEVRELERRCGI